MTSIRFKILASLLLATLSLAALSLFSLLFQNRLSAEAEQYNRTLYAEYGLAADAEELVRTYNKYRNTGNTVSRDAYQAAKSLLEQHLTETQSGVVSGVPRAALVGIVHTLERLIEITDAGAQAVAEDDIIGSTQAYEDAGRISVYIPDNVSSVILEELDLARSARALTLARVNATFRFTTTLIGIITVISLIAAVRLAKSIAQPVNDLASVAATFAGGSYDVSVPDRVLRNKDEIGSLGLSLGILFTNLKDAMQTAKDEAGDAQKARDEFMHQNKLLERLNSLFVSREDRIRVLREQVVKLGGVPAGAAGEDVDVSQEGV